MSNVVRLISAAGSDIEKMSAMELKESILKSENRVIMGQHLLFAGPGVVRNVSNSELMFAFGADMVLLNTFDLDHEEQNPGLQGMTLKELKAKCRRPIGIYLGCPKAGSEDGGKKALYRREGMVATPEHILKCREIGADFIVLGGNPGSGTSLSDIIAATKQAKDLLGDDMIVMAGKWEDGITEKVLGDPSAEYDAKEIIDQLLDAGADCIDLPCPGSRGGIMVEDIRNLVNYVHKKKPGTLTMCFLDSSVECSDTDVIRQVGILMKQTGADIHAIGDGGFGGCTWPKNIYTLSETIKGEHYTWFRMASVNR